MIAAEIMSEPVIGISPDAPLEQAIGLMIHNQISGIPVIDQEGQAVGMLTEGDLLHRVETGTAGESPGWLVRFFSPGRLAKDYIQTHARKVSEVMTRKVIGVAENALLSEVVEVMQRYRIKRVPVIRDERVVGIVSRADLMRVVGEVLGVPPVVRNDDCIRQTILDELIRESWAHLKSVSVAVEKGIVLLDGYVFDMKARSAIGVLAENVQGVKGVENRLVCVEPNSGVQIYSPDSVPQHPGRQA
jgi:CBS domain-containing protein